MDTAITINQLSKTYNSYTAVHPLTLQIERGSLFSLLGVNGAGKTTTIRMLTGLTKPTSGDATILGHSITNELAQIKKIVNLSTQETSIAPNLTVRENLEFIAGIYGISKGETQKRTDYVIEQFSLDEIESKKAKLLSGGWQRKVSIAMALITKPEVLFLDEPTLGLDVLARRELWKTIELLKGTITIILTTHYMEEAQHLSDSLAIMVKGKIRAQGNVAKLLEQTQTKNLEDAFIAIAEGGI